MSDEQLTVLIKKFQNRAENQTAAQLSRFIRIVRAFYRTHRRSLPWRTRPTPYRVLVSEIMLQQTQAKRVIPKYKDWLIHFPNFNMLAQAPRRDVLKAWQGLGYNRRALALHAIAKTVTKEYGGRLPRDAQTLIRLPHIGPNTAGAIAAYAFNLPLPFIETNIRSVFIHFFFSDAKQVSDADILTLVEKTLDRRNPREWYSALMDLGAWIKMHRGNPNKKSSRYGTQSRFSGSNRQIRGAIIRILTAHNGLAPAAILNHLHAGGIAQATDKNVRSNLETLEKEGLVERKGRRYAL